MNGRQTIQNGVGDTGAPQPEEGKHAAEGGREFLFQSGAQQAVRALAEAGTLNETQLAEFAKTQAYDETVAALAQLTAVPIEIVERLMNGERPDPILILCKAAGYSWPTARDIILARLGAKGKAAVTIDAALANFDKLSASTAKRVVRFWQMAPGSLPGGV